LANRIKKNTQKYIVYKKLSLLTETNTGLGQNGGRFMVPENK
jgi:hypothetical protein